MADPSERAFVFGALVESGYDCHLFQCTETLNCALERRLFDLVILDWRGSNRVRQDLAVIRENRSAQPKILFVNGPLTEGEIVEAFDAGADGYLNRPVSAELLRAYVKCLLRWDRGGKSVSEKFGRYVFDAKRQRVTYDGRSVVLSRREWDIAITVFRQANRPVSRQHIYDIWHCTSDAVTRALDTHVSTLRHKLDLRMGSGYELVSLYGYGYQLTVTVQFNECCEEAYATSA